MKHLLLCISFASMLLLSSCGKTSQFDLTERPDATGQVLRITDTYRIAVDMYGSIKKGPVVAGFAFEYDRNGRVSSYAIYDKKNSVTLLTVYEYDGYGHLLRITERRPDEDDIVCNVKESGNTRSYMRNNDTIVSTIQDNVVTETENGVLVARYTYDQRGRIILNENMEDADLQKYSYDDQSQNRYVLSDSEMTMDLECKPVEFDARGNWTKMHMYDKGKIIFIRERNITYWD